MSHDSFTLGPRESRVALTLYLVDDDDNDGEVETGPGHIASNISESPHTTDSRTHAKTILCPQVATLMAATDNCWNRHPEPSRVNGALRRTVCTVNEGLLCNVHALGVVRYNIND